MLGIGLAAIGGPILAEALFTPAGSAIGGSAVAAEGVRGDDDVAAGENLVYRSIVADGTVQYVGITNNIEARAATHLAQKGISIDAIPGLSNLLRADARAVEQVLIEYHGLGRNS